MKQKKLSDFKYNKPSFFNSLLIYKKRSIFHKIYYWLIDFRLFYKNKKTLKYSLISISGEIIDFSLLLLFTEIIHIFYLLSAFLSYLVALINNFLLNLRFTFKYKPLNLLDFSRSLINYFVVSISGLILNLLLIGFLVELLFLNYIIAKLISSLIIFILMYTGHNFVLGKKVIIVNK
jgi:putative flippase GtrA